MATPDPGPEKSTSPDTHVAKHPGTLQGYRYPTWLLVIGFLAWLLTLYLGYMSLAQGLPELFS